MKKKLDLIKILNQYKKDHPEYKDFVVNDRSSIADREGEEGCKSFDKFLEKIIKSNEGNIPRDFGDDN